MIEIIINGAAGSGKIVIAKFIKDALQFKSPKGFNTPRIKIYAEHSKPFKPEEVEGLDIAIRTTNNLY